MVPIDPCRPLSLPADPYRSLPTPADPAPCQLLPKPALILVAPCRALPRSSLLPFEFCRCSRIQSNSLDTAAWFLHKLMLGRLAAAPLFLKHAMLATARISHQASTGGQRWRLALALYGLYLGIADGLFHCAGMDVPVLKMIASPRRVPLCGYVRASSQNDRRGEAVFLSTGTPIPAQWNMPSAMPR